jgi:hypothetical protein
MGGGSYLSWLLNWSRCISNFLMISGWLVRIFMLNTLMIDFSSLSIPICSLYVFISLRSRWSVSSGGYLLLSSSGSRFFTFLSLLKHSLIDSLSSLSLVERFIVRKVFLLILFPIFRGVSIDFPGSFRSRSNFVLTKIVLSKSLSTILTSL